MRKQLMRRSAIKPKQRGTLMTGLASATIDEAEKDVCDPTDSNHRAKRQKKPR